MPDLVPVGERNLRERATESHKEREIDQLITKYTEAYIKTTIEGARGIYRKREREIKQTGGR